MINDLKKWSHLLVQEFVVVVEQNGSVVHGGESECRDANLPYVSAVSSGREDPGGDLQIVLVGAPLESLQKNDTTHFTRTSLLHMYR